MAAIQPKQKTTFDKYKENIYYPIRDSIFEMGNLFPDSVLFGSLLMYIITQNVSLGVLSVFTLEMSLFHKVISFVYTKVIGPPKPGVDGTKTVRELKCRPGYKAARLDYDAIFRADTPPSLPAFFWGGLVAYMAGSNASFVQVLQSMGQEWWTRIIVSVIGIILLTILFLLSRTDCESFTEVILALIMGIVFGIIFYFINLNVFGLEGVNFNGLPLLQNKTDSGSAIYVCAPPQN
jgi:hypothetical protein